MKARAFLLSLFTLLVMNDTSAQLRDVKIAMAQIFLLDGDRSGNLVRIENAVAAAKKKGADIVVFPESSILGWINAKAHERAQPIPGTDSDRLSAMARNHQIFICIGLDEKEGDKLFDSALLIDDTGRIIYKHRKINVLPELMTPPYSIGSTVGTVPTKFGNVGVMICADSFQEDVLAKMKEKKPDLLLIPYGWAAEENEWPEHGKELEKVVTNAAVTMRCPVIGTDLIGEISDGPWKGKTYGGQSVAADANGKVLAVGKDRDTDLVMVSVKIRK